MCSLPKASFYFYFAFFFLGYIWIFSVYFHNVWENKETAKSKQEQIAQRDQAPPALGQLPFRDISGPAPPPDPTQMPCVQTRSDPSFQICLHHPDIDKSLSVHINLFKEWEPDLTASISSILRQNPKALFVDVGANVGYFSLYAALLGHKVVAIEPFGDNLDRLHHAAQLNKLQSSITVLETLVSDSRHSWPVVNEPDNLGGRFVISNEVMDFNFRARARVHMSSILLDDLLLLPQVLDAVKNETEIVLKVDIQGSECHAILGAQQLLRSAKVVALFMEWEETRKLYRDEPRCVRDALEVLHNHQFKAHALDGSLIEKLDPQDLNVPQNIVWTVQS